MTQVTAYGNLDLSVGSFKRFVTPQDVVHRTDRVESGLTSGTYLGFKGQESIGKAWVASFKLESAISVDTGAVSPEPWERTCEVGLAAGWGAIQAGKSLSLSFRASLLQSPFTVFRPLGLSGATNFGPFQSNSLTYGSPVFAGWQLVGQYGAREGNGSHDIHSAQILFTPGVLALAFTLTQDAQSELLQVGGSYGTDVLKWFGQVARAKGPTQPQTLPVGHLHMGVLMALDERHRIRSAWTRTHWDGGRQRDALAIVFEQKWSPQLSVYAGGLWQAEKNGVTPERRGSSAFMGWRQRF